MFFRVVSPVYRPRLLFNNFQLISKLQFLSKVLEKVVFSELLTSAIIDLCVPVFILPYHHHLWRTPKMFSSLMRIRQRSLIEVLKNEEPNFLGACFQMSVHIYSLVK